MTDGLMLHTGKTMGVTFADLLSIPTPAPMGRIHKPVAHADLVQAIRAEVKGRGFEVRKETFGITRNAMKLFGTMDLALAGGLQSKMEGALADERGMMLGFRSANDQSFPIAGVAGSRVFVCDNMVLSGDMFAFSKRHTIGLDLLGMIKAGFDRFIGQFKQLDTEIERLSLTPLNDGEAKVKIYDAFAQQILPARLFDDVHAFYFKATDETPDTQPRTMMGLHNAFTRAVKVLRPTVQFAATVALGKAFALRTAIDAVPETVQ